MKSKQIAFAVVLILVIAVLLFRAGTGKRDPGINWLDLKQTAAPSQIEALRENLEEFLVSAQSAVGMSPRSVMSTGEFFKIHGGAALELLPLAVSTNADGTLAAVLEPGASTAMARDLRGLEQVEDLGSPRIANMARVRGRLSSFRLVNTSAGARNAGQSLDLISYIEGTNIHTRLIAQVTEPVTNSVPDAAEGTQTETVSVETVFQAGLEARIPDGGAVAVWNAPTDTSEPFHLLLLTSTTQLTVPAPSGASNNVNGESEE